jgi:Bacterial Ig-like domain (group 3)/FG-GAP-like repeat
MHSTSKECHYIVTVEKIIEINLQVLLASGRLRKRADYVLSCFPEFTAITLDRRLTAMQSRSLQTFLGALTCALFLALGVTDSSAQGLSPASSSQKSARIAALQAQQKSQENTPAAMPKIQHLVFFRKPAPAGKAQPKTAAKTRNATATPNAAGLANFPATSTVPYIAATLQGDSNAITVSASGHFRSQSNLDVVTFQEDGTLNLLTNNGKGNFTLASSNTSYSGGLLGIIGISTAVAADMNGDGIDDIVAVDSGDNNLLVYLSNGDGTFANAIVTPVTSATGAIFNPFNPFGNNGGGGIAVADVNHDGKPDVVTVQGFAGVTPSIIAEQTFLNTGNGNLTASPEVDTTIQDAIEFSTGPGQSVILSDVNGDQNPDLLMEYFDANSNQTVISVSLGLGNAAGTFGPLQTAAASSDGLAGGSFPNPAFQVADLNGDGHPDLVYLPGDGTAALALGNGDGTFGAPNTVLNNLYVPLVGTNAQEIQVGDFNSDGLPDLLIYSAGALAVYTGDGVGTFSAAPDGQFAVNSYDGAQFFPAFPQEPAPADFDGDGNLDVPVADAFYGTFSLVHGLGNGRFRAPPAVAPNNTSTTLPNNTEATNNIQVAAVGDVNGDGRADVLAIDWSNLDVNGDPDADIGLSNGKGGFSFSTVIPAATIISSGAAAVVPALSDFNNDGHFDLLLLTAEGLSIALSQPDGTLGAPVPLNLPMAALDCSDGNVAIGDINGDGNLDFVMSYAGNTQTCTGGSTPSGYFVGLGNGAGAFTVTFTPYGTSLSQTLLSDFNGDGKPDLAVFDAVAGFNTPSSITVLPGNGDGTFNVATAKPVLSTWIIGGMQIGDFNADGKQDLTLLSQGNMTTAGQSPDPSTFGILLLQGNGDFTFGQPVVIAPGTEETDVAYADINGDGLPDLIATVFTTLNPPAQYFGLSILPNQGMGMFGAPINLLAPSGLLDPSGLSATLVGDFNGDGLPDLLEEGGGISFDTDNNGFASVVYINQGGSAVALTATPTTVVQGAAVTLQAVVRVPPGSPAPTGSVTFSSGGTQLGNVPLSGSNTVQFAASGLPAGTSIITAAYSGDSNHEATTSAMLSVVVQPLPPSFSLTATPQTVNITAGQSGSVTLNFQTNPTFSGTIMTTCSGLPAGATCTFNPTGGLALTGGHTGSVQVSIATTASTTMAMSHFGIHTWGRTAGGLAIAQALLLLWPRRRKKIAGMLGTSLMVLFGMVLVLSATGCGGGSNGSSGSSGSGSVKASSAVVTITSTSTSGGATVTQTAAVSVVITQ